MHELPALLGSDTQERDQHATSATELCSWLSQMLANSLKE